MSGEHRCVIGIRTFGELKLYRGSEADLGNGLEQILAQPKRLSLLLYLALALPRGFHRRDALLAMFWPEADRARAGSSLRQALHFLRRQLPEGILVNRGTEDVGVAHERIQCDAARFDSALDAGREADALEQYRGDLLPGFHLAGCPDFERWLEMERGRLRRRASRGALVLAYRNEEAGKPAEAAEWARAAVYYAPYDEASLRDVVRLLDRLGNRTDAIEMYNALAERLTGELGVVPSEQTRSLIADLRSGRTHDVPAESPQAAAGSSTRRRSPVSQRPLVGGRVSLEAYHAYQRARHHDELRTPSSMQRALEEYENAVRLEPNFALAHTGIARALGILAVYAAYSPSEVYPRVKHHAAKAAALDPDLAEARQWLANAHICYEWDWAAAERELKRAIELDPSSSHVRREYALYLLTPTGRFSEAVEEIELARELDPMSMPLNTYVGAVCYFARQYDRAIRELRATLERNENFPLAWWFLGMAYEQTGDIEDALAAISRAVTLTHGSSLMLAQLGRVRARLGDHEGAETVLNELADRGETVGPTPHFTASIHAALGRNDEALDWLYRAYRDRTPHMVFTNVFPPFDGLRTERRFRELLLRLGLR